MARAPLELVRLAADRLAACGVENGRLEAEYLLAHLLGLNRLELYLQYDRPLGEEEVSAYRQSLRRRLRGEPLQYIIGETQFRELRLKVDRRVLIPRPETEVLVARVLDWAVSAGAAANGALSAVDLGTGSGAIALSLLREGPFTRVVATDICSEALALAAENAEAVDLTAGLELRCGSLWSVFSAGEQFDVVVSNPPYVAESDGAALPPEVREWEPALALYAGADGLAVLDQVIAGAARHLRSGGLLALEVGENQAGSVARRLGARPGFGKVSIRRDLAGKDRIVLAERSRVQTGIDDHG